MIFGKSLFSPSILDTKIRYLKFSKFRYLKLREKISGENPGFSVFLFLAHHLVLLIQLPKHLYF